jgi:5-methylcytosine-specific restriction endonuclease McrA
MFWGGIRSALRQKSRWWKPMAECKKLSRRKYVGTNKRRKWEFKCAKCKEHFPDKEVQVDHIIPAGTLKHYKDLAGFVERLFCEIEGFQVLCTTCHNIKTQNERKNK